MADLPARYLLRDDGLYLDNKGGGVIWISYNAVESYLSCSTPVDCYHADGTKYFSDVATQVLGVRKQDMWSGAITDHVFTGNCDIYLDDTKTTLFYKAMSASALKSIKINPANPKQLIGTLMMPIRPGEVHKVTYSVGNIKTASGGELTPFSKLSITNNTH